MRPKRWSSTALLAGALLAAGPLLAGCSAVEDGISGITVNASGDIVGLVHTCKHPVIGASLSTQELNGSGRTLRIGRWERATALGKDASIVLSDDPGAGWSATRATTELSTLRTYEFGGFPDNHNYSARRVSFTLADVAKLKPGQIRINFLDSEAREHHDVVTATEFVERACPT